MSRAYAVYTGFPMGKKLTIAEAKERAASEWGNEYVGGFKKLKNNTFTFQAMVNGERRAIYRHIETDIMEECQNGAWVLTCPYDLLSVTTRGRIHDYSNIHVFRHKDLFWMGRNWCMAYPYRRNVPWLYGEPQVSLWPRLVHRMICNNDEDIKRAFVHWILKKSDWYSEVRLTQMDSAFTFCRMTDEDKKFLLTWADETRHEKRSAHPIYKYIQKQLKYWIDNSAEAKSILNVWMKEGLYDG